MEDRLAGQKRVDAAMWTDRATDKSREEKGGRVKLRRRKKGERRPSSLTSTVHDWEGEPDLHWTGWIWTRGEEDLSKKDSKRKFWHEQ